jgi:hypothetical protein
MNGSIVDFRGPIQIQKVEIRNTIQRRTIHEGKSGGVIFKAIDKPDLATRAHILIANVSETRECFGQNGCMRR